MRSWRRCTGNSCQLPVVSCQLPIGFGAGDDPFPPLLICSVAIFAPPVSPPIGCRISRLCDGWGSWVEFWVGGHDHGWCCSFVPSAVVASVVVVMGDVGVQVTA